MKTTTVRFSEDLWRLLQVEAERAEVSVSQYIREASLARAVAAAARRGMSSSDTLSRAVAHTVRDGRSEELERTLLHVAALISD